MRVSDSTEPPAASSNGQDNQAARVQSSMVLNVFKDKDSLIIFPSLMEASIEWRTNRWEKVAKKLEVRAGKMAQCLPLFQRTWVHFSAPTWFMVWWCCQGVAENSEMGPHWRKQVTGVCSAKTDVVSGHFHDMSNSIFPIFLMTSLENNGIPETVCISS